MNKEKSYKYRVIIGKIDPFTMELVTECWIMSSKNKLNSENSVELYNDIQKEVSLHHDEKRVLSIVEVE